MQRKLIFLITLLLLTGIAVNAQLKKGNRMAGASVGSIFYNGGTSELSNSITTTSTSTNNFGLSIIPSYGWFISDNTVIGIAPMIDFRKNETVGKASNGNTFLKDEFNQYSVGLGGFARNYFRGSNNGPLHFFGQYNLGFGIGGNKNEGFEYETLGVYVDRYNLKSSGNFFVNTGVTLGASKFLNSHTSLDFYLGYTFS